MFSIVVHTAVIKQIVKVHEALVFKLFPFDLFLLNYHAQ